MANEPARTVSLPVPGVEFFLFNPNTPPPEPASPTVRGILPARGVQMCPPVTEGSGFGWYVYPPLDFALRWDGQTMEFARLADNEPAGWQSLAGGYDLWLEEDQEVLLGLIARTPEGWSLLMRDVPNWPKARDHQILEGVIDTAWYGGPIPIMVRMLETGRVVRFYRTIPMAVAQLLLRIAIEASQKSPAEPVSGIQNFPDDVWQRFVEHRRRRVRGKGRGTYRAQQRRQARAAAAPDEDA
jgi:Family of unknown function (DUF6065)